MTDINEVINDEIATFLALRKEFEGLTEERKVKIQECYNKLMTTIKENGEDGVMAFCILVGAVALSET